MSKAIIISIKPKYVADILKGIKTLEIRKNMPKCELPIDVYIYCTKDNYIGHISNKYVGKVVAKFTLNEIKDIYTIYFPYEYFYKATDLTKEQLEEKSCLGQIYLDQYLRKKKGYAWVINNLEIFNEPKELNVFKVHKNDCPFPCFACDVPYCKLKRPPQSWCYIEI